MEFKYPRPNEKKENIRKANYFQGECDKYKEKFEKICEKIKNDSEIFIDSARNSTAGMSATGKY